MRRLPMFPLGTVLVPYAHLPLHVFEPRYRALTHARPRRPTRPARLPGGHPVPPRAHGHPGLVGGEPARRPAPSAPRPAGGRPGPPQPADRRRLEDLYKPSSAATAAAVGLTA